MRLLNPDCFPKVAAQIQPPLEQIPLHGIDRGDFDILPIEPLKVFPEGFITSLDDYFQGRLRFWVLSGSREVHVELFLQVSQGMDIF